MRSDVAALLAVACVVVGAAVGMFVPQVHQAYVTDYITETETRHATETESHTVHLTETTTSTTTIGTIERLTLTVTVFTTTTKTTAPAGYAIYSKWGFSFEYPLQMKLLESGMVGTDASDEDGMIIGSLDSIEVIAVAWMELIGIDPTSEYLKDALEIALDQMVATGAATSVDRGLVVETEKAGHLMVYQYYNVTLPGQVMYSIYAAWYCADTQRLYQFNVMQENDDPLPKFQRYMDSFVCHG